MKGEAMEPDRTTQSAELTRIEKLTADWIPESPWPTAVAWMRNREATEALLLRMVKKLTPAAKETPTECICAGLPYWDPKCPMHGLIETPDPPATPQPAPAQDCKHPWSWLNFKGTKNNPEIGEGRAIAITCACNLMLATIQDATVTWVEDL
jgi:hypothetical protein